MNKQLLYRIVRLVSPDPDVVDENRGRASDFATQKLLFDRLKVALEPDFVFDNSHDKANALYALACKYLGGAGVKRNPKKAIKLFKTVYEMDYTIHRLNAKACCEIGHCYEAGIGVYKDTKKAHQWFHKALLCYSSGESRKTAEEEINKERRRKKNWREAESRRSAVKECWARLRAKWNPEANLDIECQDARRVVATRREAMAGNFEAQVSIVRAYTKGFGIGIKRDYVEGFAWFKQLPKGHDRCEEEWNLLKREMTSLQTMVGEIRAKELRTEIQANVSRLKTEAEIADSVKLSEMLAKAKQGDPEAQNFMGDKFSRGDGVAKDYAQAVSWYRKAVGNPAAGSWSKYHAYWELGQCYVFGGYGVEQDSAASKEYCRLAELARVAHTDERMEARRKLLGGY